MYKFAFATMLLASTVTIASSQVAPFGTFSGPLEVRMHGDRDGTLLATFEYIDPQGKKWRAPKGATVNGASIPRPLWSLIGSPWTGRYREASVVHDYYCEQRTEPWKAVHRTFYTAMRANGVEPLTAKVMYAGVYRFGPRWNFEYIPKCPNCIAVTYQVGAYRSPFDEKEFKALQAKIQLTDPTLEQIETDADAAFMKEIGPKELGAPNLHRN